VVLQLTFLVIISNNGGVEKRTASVEPAVLFSSRLYNRQEHRRNWLIYGTTDL
jgi:hypothetical protein